MIRMRKMFAVSLMVLLVFNVINTSSFAADTIGDVEVKLLAGQNIEVGNVIISQTDDSLVVTYSIDDSDWAIYETHLEVSETLEDIPTNKAGNPQIGHFEYNETHNGVQTYTVEIPLAELVSSATLYIAAHAVVQKIESIIITEAPYGGSSVTAIQGLRYDGTEVTDVRSDADSALVFESEVVSEEAYFLSLGFRSEDLDDAWAIIEFDTPIINGPGNDIQVVEDTWGTYPAESASVYVSEDGDTWLYMGEADNSNAINHYNTISEFDLDDVGLEEATYVMVQDSSLRSDFVDYPDLEKYIPDGYDLNVVLALHDNVEITTLQDETAWADGEKFVPKGSWATYIMYPTGFATGTSIDNVSELVVEVSEDVKDKTKNNKKVK